MAALFLPCLVFLAEVLVARSARTSGRARGAAAQESQGQELVHSPALTEPQASPSQGGHDDEVDKQVQNPGNTDYSINGHYQ